LRPSIAEPHVEDVVALLATGLGRSGKGCTLGCRRDAIPVDHPGTRLDAVGDQVLRLGGRCGPAINDVAAGGESWGC
jgi:hypothetical protein